MSTQNVNVARYARNVEWDFFCDFQTLCSNSNIIPFKNKFEILTICHWKKTRETNNVTFSSILFWRCHSRQKSLKSVTFKKKISKLWIFHAKIQSSKHDWKIFKFSRQNKNMRHFWRFLPTVYAATFWLFTYTTQPRIPMKQT